MTTSVMTRKRTTHRLGYNRRKEAFLNQITNYYTIGKQSGTTRVPNRRTGKTYIDNRRDNVNDWTGADKIQRHSYATINEQQAWLIRTTSGWR